MFSRTELLLFVGNFACSSLKRSATFPAFLRNISLFRKKLELVFSSSSFCRWKSFSKQCYLEVMNSMARPFNERRGGNRPFAAKPSRDLLFIILWSIA